MPTATRPQLTEEALNALLVQWFKDAEQDLEYYEDLEPDLAKAISSWISTHQTTNLPTNQ